MDDEKLKMLLLRARAVEESMNKNKSTVKYKKSGKDCQSGGKHPVSASVLTAIPKPREKEKAEKKSRLTTKGRKRTLLAPNTSLLLEDYENQEPCQEQLQIRRVPQGKDTSKSRVPQVKDTSKPRGPQEKDYPKPRISRKATRPALSEKMREINSTLLMSSDEEEPKAVKGDVNASVSAAAGVPPTGGPRVAVDVLPQARGVRSAVVTENIEDSVLCEAGNGHDSSIWNLISGNVEPLVESTRISSMFDQSEQSDVGTASPDKSSPDVTPLPLHPQNFFLRSPPNTAIKAPQVAAAASLKPKTVMAKESVADDTVVASPQLSLAPGKSHPSPCHVKSSGKKTLTNIPHHRTEGAIQRISLVSNSEKDFKISHKTRNTVKKKKPGTKPKFVAAVSFSSEGESSDDSQPPGMIQPGVSFAIPETSRSSNDESSVSIAESTGNKFNLDKTMILAERLNRILPTNAGKKTTGGGSGAAGGRPKKKRAKAKPAADAKKRSVGGKENSVHNISENLSVILSRHCSPCNKTSANSPSYKILVPDSQPTLQGPKAGGVLDGSSAIVPDTPEAFGNELDVPDATPDCTTCIPETPCVEEEPNLDEAPLAGQQVKSNKSIEFVRQDQINRSLQVSLQDPVTDGDGSLPTSAVNSPASHVRGDQSVKNVSLQVSLASQDSLCESAGMDSLDTTSTANPDSAAEPDPDTASVCLQVSLSGTQADQSNDIEEICGKLNHTHLAPETSPSPASTSHNSVHLSDANASSVDQTEPSDVSTVSSVNEELFTTAIQSSPDDSLQCYKTAKAKRTSRKMRPQSDGLSFSDTDNENLCQPDIEPGMPNDRSHPKDPETPLEKANPVLRLFTSIFGGSPMSNTSSSASPVNNTIARKHGKGSGSSLPVSTPSTASVDNSLMSEDEDSILIPPRCQTKLQLQKLPVPRNRSKTEQQDDSSDTSLPDLRTSPARRRPEESSDDEEELEAFFTKMKKTPGNRARTINHSDDDDDDFIVPDDEVSSDASGDSDFYAGTNRVLETQERANDHTPVTVAASGSPDTAVATPDLTLSSDDDWFVVTPVAPPSKPKSQTCKPPTRQKRVREISSISTPFHGSHTQWRQPRPDTDHGREKQLAFLPSLSSQVASGKKDPEAAMYIKSFKKLREELTARLFSLYNKTVFSNKLPSDLSIKWNSRLTKTAGYCAYKRDPAAPDGKTARVELSVKVCDSPERVRDTLIHELCHAAVWLFYGKTDGHGPHWKKWAMRANLIHPDLPVIARCHSYDIQTKYTYRCTKCGYEIGRHSKSLDVTKKVCGYCMSPFELITNTRQSPSSTTQTPKTPNRFALFVKENYASAKSQLRGGSHKDVMTKLSADFAAKNKI